MLQKLIADLGAHDIHFLGHVTDAELAAYYEVADLFLCASEHEGFCVPLMEAFHVGLPVVAYAATAIPATMDGGGVLYTDKDPAHVAAIVDAVVSDPDSARRRSSRPRMRRWRGCWRATSPAWCCGFVERVRAMPPQPAPPIAFDFWDRFASTQQLEELHQYRPAAYSALPRRPALAEP